MKFNIICFCQTAQLNHFKYHLYKSRLKTEFMYVDSCDEYTSGSGIPMSHRNYIDSIMAFGDETIELANYLQVLATEYSIRKNNSLPVAVVLSDLHTAIETFARLDKNAESLFRKTRSKPSEKDINGFFIRDDIDTNYIKKYWQYFNHADSLWKVSSDLIKHQDHTNKYAVEMSKDQCWHLFIGFALIQKLLNGITIIDTYGNQYNFSNKIKQITKLVYGQLIGCKHHKWNIKNPANGHKLSEDRGGKVRLYSYGFACGAGDIVGENLHAWNSNSIWWRTVYFITWKWESWRSDDFGARALAVVGNTRNSSTFEYLVKESKQKHIFSYPHFALIYLLLHPDMINKTNLQHIRFILDDLKLHLNQAPINGPSYNAPTYWSSHNTVVWPEKRKKGKLGDRYNGLDYMLLHNLYYIINKKYVKLIINTK